MSATLRSFQAALSQVAPLMGPDCSPRAALIGGVLAVALAAPGLAGAQTLRITPGGIISSEQPASGAGSSEGISPAAAVTIGRIVGGITGFTVGRATGANSAVTAALSVLGIVGGGMAAGAIVDKGKELPADVQDRMTVLALDAAAWRLVAQQHLVAADSARLQAVTSPNVEWLAEASRTSEKALAQSMTRYRGAFQNLRSAVTVASGQGFAVAEYAQAAKALAAPVDAKNMLPLNDPAIKDRARQLESSMVAAAGPADSQPATYQNVSNPRGYARPPQ